MKYHFTVRNKTAQSLLLACALVGGLPTLAYAHEDTPDQGAEARRPIPPDRAVGSQNGSARRDDPAGIPNQGSGINREGRTTDRVNQNMAPDRDARPLDRPEPSWGDDRSGGHGGGH